MLLLLKNALLNSYFKQELYVRGPFLLTTEGKLIKICCLGFIPQLGFSCMNRFKCSSNKISVFVCYEVSKQEISHAANLEEKSFPYVIGFSCGGVFDFSTSIVLCIWLTSARCASLKINKLFLVLRKVDDWKENFFLFTACLHFGAQSRLD